MGLSLAAPLIPHCPRCGYDLSGVMAAWDEACPLDGTCSECGLGFRWSEVVDARRLIVPGFIEHAERGLRVLFASAWRTLAWIPLPWIFWSRVRLEHAVVPRRWLMWAVCVLLPFHAAASFASNARLLVNPALFGLRPGAPTLTGQLWWTVSGWTYPFVAINGWSGPPRLNWLVEGFPLVVWMTLAAHSMFWALMLILPTTRATVGVRALHVHRAGVYGLAWIVALFVFRAVRNTWLATQAAVAAQPPGARGARVLRIGELPLGLTSAILLGWTCAWWLWAVRAGWRVRDWQLLWGLLTVSALLGAAIVWQWLPEVQQGTWWYLLPWTRMP